MLVNADTKIRGLKVILVPYTHEHVKTYHTWMRDPVLQSLTESEPLTLQQEYDMQESWRKDTDKCTFILLDPSIPGHHGGAMAGDVNVFLTDPEDPHLAEIEVMIAEHRSRRKGLAKEAVELMMQYSMSRLGAKGFVAKIINTNVASLRLFKKLGFVKLKDVAVFKEVHYILNEGQCPQAWLHLQQSIESMQTEVFST